MKNIILLSAFFLFAVSCQKESNESIVSKPLEVSDNELINYIEYCNDRFKICIDYPSNFNPRPEPVNGDGRTFVNTIDSAEIVLYGFLDHGNEGLDIQLDILGDVMDIENIKSIENGKDILGTQREDGRIHHEKLLIKPDPASGTYDDGSPVNIIYSLQLVYPKSKQKKYADYWQRLNKKFR